jgi:ligand-binding sensor domain-containing protein
MSAMNFPKPINRPGLSQIAYRIADYASFRQALLDVLATRLSEDPNQGGPLAQLTTRSPDDPAIALLDAWAVVGDVLTFYQERLINEAFLRTATERRSIVELARAIGYQLSPGVAASTELAFTVEASAEVATVPQGTQILSIPTGDALPQTFETLSPLMARADWNALKPRSTRPQQVTPETRQLYLQGINLTLQPGDRLLLHDADPKQPQDYLLTLDTITVIPARGSTRVTWSQQLPAQIAAPLREPQVFTFQQRAGLFGQVAPRWENLSNELKRSSGGTLRGGVFGTADTGASWQARSQGLPNVDMQCVAINPRGHLFIGTPSNGIWRSTDNGTTWAAVNAGLINPNVQTLWINDLAQLFAGTTSGQVFRSKDNGDNWVLISQGTVRLKPDGTTNRLESVNTGIPNTVIHALVTYTPPLQTPPDTEGSDKKPVKTTLKSEGTKVTLSAEVSILNVGDTITAAGQSKTITKKDNQDKKGLTIDTSFTLDLPEGSGFYIGGTYLWAGTDEGVYRSQDEGKNWSPKGLPTRSVRALFILPSMPGTGKILLSNNQVIVVDSKSLKTGDRILLAGKTYTVKKALSDFSSFEIGIDPSAIPVGSAFVVLPSLVPDLYVATDDGVFRSSDYGNTWAAISTGLTNRDVRCLAAYTQFGQGTISSQGTTVTGVGTTFSTELNVGDVVMAADQARVVLAIGADTQLTLDSAFNQDLPANTAFYVRRSDTLFAGTADGVFLSSDRGDTWTAASQTGLTQRAISDLSAYVQPGEGTISIADTVVTGTGTAFTRELTVGDRLIVAGQTATIASINSDTALTLTSSLGILSTLPFRRPLLIASTPQGIFRSGNPQSAQSSPPAWRAINTGLTSLGATALAIALKPGVGTLASTDTTVTGTNTRFTTALSIADTITVLGQTRTVTAIVSDTTFTVDAPFSEDLLPGSRFISQMLFAGTAFAGFVEDEWPHFQVHPTAIDLDTLYAKVLVDSWLVLVDDNPLGQQFQAIQVQAIANAARQNFGLDLKISRVVPVTPIEQPSRFRLRDTAILAQSQAIALADELLTVDAQQHQIFADPIAAQQVWLSQFVTGLRPEQPLIVSGKRIRATVNVGGFLHSAHWSPSSFTEPVLALAIDDQGQHFAGTAKGAFRSQDGGQTWTEITALQNRAVTAFVSYPRPDLGATLVSVGADVGLKCDRGGTAFLTVGSTLTAAGQTRTIVNRDRLKIDPPFSASWTDAAFDILTGTTSQRGSGTITSTQDNTVTGSGTDFLRELNIGDRIRVGGESGEARTVTLFFLTIDAPFSEDLPPNTPCTLATLFAGTADGVFSSPDHGQSWEPVGSGLTSVQALAISTSALFAGTRNQGVWMLTGSQWTAIGLTHERIQALLVETGDSETDHTVWAGTPQGLWRTRTNGQQWRQFTQTKRGTGTIACSGTELRGQGTQFSQLVAGSDQLWAAGQTRTVSQVQSDTAVTLEAAFGPEVSGSRYRILRRFLAGRVTVRDTQVLGVGGLAFTADFRAGDGIALGGQVRIVRSLVSATELALDAPLREDIGVPGVEFSRVRLGLGTIGEVEVQGTNTAFTQELRKGDRLTVKGETRTVTAISSDTILTVDAAFSASLPTGTTFTADTGLTNANITALALAQSQTQSQTQPYLFAGTDRGVFVSDDRGEHWQPRSTNLTELAVRCLAMTSDRSALFVGTANGVWRSTTADHRNLADLWLPLSVGLTNRQVNALALAFQANALPNSSAPQGPDLLAGTAGGVFYSTELGTHRQQVQWERSNQGLPHPIAHALVVYPHAKGITLWLGGSDGVFRSTDNGDTWQPAEVGLTNPEVRSLALLVINNQRQLFAGTPDGIFRSIDQGQTWQLANADLTHVDVQVLLAQSPPLVPSPQLWAGMQDGGVFRSLDQGVSWVPSGLTNRNIRALTANPVTGTLFAGTANSGIWRSTDNGGFWTQLVTEKLGTGTVASTGTQVTGSDTTFTKALKVGSRITAGDQVRIVGAIASDTSLTVTVAFRPDLPLGTTFSSNTGLATPHITALIAAAPQGTGTISTLTVMGTNTQFKQELTVGRPIVAMGQTRVVKQILSDTELTTDQPFNPPLAIGTAFALDVTANAPTRTGTIASQAPTTVTGTKTTFSRELSVGSQIRAASQTRVVTQVLSDTALMIDQPFKPPLPAGTPFSLDYLYAGTDGSGIFLSRDAGETWTLIAGQLELLDIRCLALDLGDLLAGTARHGVFRGCIVPDQAGDPWQWTALNSGLTNTEVRAIVTDHPTQILIAGVGILLSPDLFYATPVKPDDQLWVIAPPMPDPTTPDPTAETPTQQQTQQRMQQWSLVDRNDFNGIVTAAPADITLHPAAPEDPIVSERVAIARPPTDQALPILTLDAPLENSYDPATVSLYGNVVSATHGATVRATLGSGDGTAAHQRFELKKPPLTYTPAPTAQGAETTLQVFVNDVRWQEARSLYALDALSTKYLVQIEDDGTTQVIFGDGQKGARLPSGLDNITAIYRSGIGLDGNVAADSLALLKTRPLGIVEVTNPKPASGGADREDLATAQSQAPATVRTLDRIVSRQDFEDFARTFAGIGKAKATTLWAGETQLVHLSIVDMIGDAVDPESVLYDSLVQAMAAARDPSQRVQVDSAAAQQFNVEAKVLVDSRYLPEKVIPAIRDRLLTTFAFAQRHFGQNVTAAEAIAVIQAIPGVVAVDLDALYRLGTAKTLLDVVPAELARWDETTQMIHPARLLLINPQGIILTPETLP